MWSRLPAYDLRLGGMQPSFDPSGDAVRVGRLRADARGNTLFVVDAATQTRPRPSFTRRRAACSVRSGRRRAIAIIFGIGHFGAFFNGFHDLFLGKADRVDGGAQIAMIKRMAPASAS